MELLTIGSGLLTGAAAPFLIQLFKRLRWTGKKAQAYSFSACFVIAAVWTILAGKLPSSGFAAFSLEWWGWFVGAVGLIYSVATGMYRWLETAVFKKIPNLAALATKVVRTK